MLTDSAMIDTVRRSGILRSAAAGSGMRGMDLGACCGECASGLGDVSVPALPPEGIPRWLFMAALGLGAIASGVLLWDRFSPRKRRAKRRGSRVGEKFVYIPGPARRRRSTTGARHTLQLPVESMAEVVYGRRT